MFYRILAYGDWLVHQITSAANVVGLENLKNLDKIRDTEPVLLKEWSREVFLDLLRVILTSPLFFLSVFLHFRG